ncbi:MAG TPA: cation:proton antiporter [Pyrinomonadaceae bacterium]|jgi:Kef-type K+ transport system membrane component KefB
MKRKAAAILTIFGVIALIGQRTLAVGGVEGVGEPGASHGLAPMVLLGVAAILVIAKVCGGLFERLGQPAVLGELTGGIVAGNLVLLGFHGVEALKTNEIIASLAEIGVIILLFEVGLESNLAEMLEVGWSSLMVAVLGVIVPFFLGWMVAAYFIPQEARLVHIFIGATLCATSVGITARVLKDMGRLTTREARIILGAAVIDDVLGLLILAVVAGAIRAQAAGAALGASAVIIIAVKAIAFLFVSIVLGHYVMPYILRGLGRFEGQGVLLAISLAFCFFLAWAASMVGLAPIVGAFAAGLILDEVSFESMPNHEKKDLERLLNPVSTLLVPIFFVLMGLKVDLRTFLQPQLLGFAAVLTLAAIIGKQICALGVLERGTNRLAVGLGMIPRGEVGLIFAGLGATLMLPDAAGTSLPVIGPATFGVVVIMVIMTTLVTPPALKWSLERTKKTQDTDPPATLIREVGEDAAERTTH